MDLEVVDPCVDPEEAQREYDLKVLSDIPTNANYSAVAAVSHQEFVSLSLEQWKQLVLPGGLLFDLKVLCRAVNFASVISTHWNHSVF